MIIRKLDGLMRNVNGKQFIIPISNEYAKRGAFFEVNAIGSNIWNMIEQGNDVKAEELISMVSNDYHVERDVVEMDIQEFISQLESRKLVELVK